jgi:hypothetical protein
MKKVCYLPKSGRHVTSLDHGLSSSEARSGKSLGTRLLPNSFFGIGGGKSVWQISFPISEIVCIMSFIIRLKCFFMIGCGVDLKGYGNKN